MSIRVDPTDPLSTLLTIDQAADIAHVTRRTLNRWIAAGRLKPYWVGRKAFATERAVLEAERTAWRDSRIPGPGRPAKEHAMTNPTRRKLPVTCLVKKGVL